MDAAERILKHSEEEKQQLKKNLSSHLIFSFTGLLTHLASPPTLPDQPMFGVSENLDSVAFGHNWNFKSLINNTSQKTNALKTGASPKQKLIQVMAKVILVDWVNAFGGS